ncbi:MAG: hypothetical protein N4A74_07100 [Carboxylicivirga sp.]|nr:hypothetical protein [Carboxylicivirga sp.]
MKKMLLLFFLGLLNPFLYGQNDVPSLRPPYKEIIEPSPKAASILSHTSIPVNLHQGAVNLSIPIYEIHAKDIKIPINLSYDGTGRKVSERASWVGLGWNLTGEGVITRIVKGLPDEAANGYLSSYKIWKDDYAQMYEQTQFVDRMKGNTDHQNGYSFACELSSGVRDTEPDEFYYNFLGYTGRIYFNSENSAPVLVPYENMDIVTCYLDNASNKWIIRTPCGKEVIFANRGIEYYNDGQLNSYTYPNTWYMTEVRSCSTPSNKVVFNYSELISSTEDLPSITPITFTYLEPEKNIHGEVCSNIIPPPNNSGDKYMLTRYLKSITYGDTEIKFDSDPNRGDTRYLYMRKLNAISILNKEKTVKSTIFLTSYFNGESSDFEEKRLRLDAINYQGHPEYYQFSYNEQVKLPSYFSTSIDHWGYFNDAGNGKYLIQSLNCEEEKWATSTHRARADRETNPNVVDTYMLNKIIYPTGGSTELEYEAHEYKEEDYSAKSFRINLDDNYAMLNCERTASNTLLNPLDRNYDIIVRFDRFQLESKRNVSIDMSSAGVSRAPRELRFYRFSTNAKSLTQDEIMAFAMGISPTYILKNSTEIDMEAGHYLVLAIKRKDISCTAISADINWCMKKLEKRFVGGVRIKEMKFITGTDTLTKHYTYYKNSIQQGGDKESSLRIFYEPRYIFNDFCSRSYACIYQEKRLGRIPYGGHLGYKEVMESQKSVNGTMGYTVYKYNNKGFYEDRDILLSKEMYDDNRRMIEKNKSNPLKIDLPQYKSCDYLSIDIVKIEKYLFENPFGQISNYTNIKWDIRDYKFGRSSWTGIDSTINTSYIYKDELLLDSVKTINVNSYNNPVYKRISATEVSDYNKKVRTEKIFANDDLLTYSDIVNKGLQNTVVEEKKFLLKEGKPSHKLEHYKYSYGINNNNVSLDNIEKLSGEQFFTVGNYLHNDKNNLIEKGDYNAPVLVYHWGYNNQYPVAKISNYQFISYESNTSLKSNLALLEGYTVIDDGNRASLELLNRNIRNNLPDDALITTYTYDPLIGVTSQTDPNGLATYYEYDDFGQLTAVKNSDNKLVSSHVYHYAEQPVSPQLSVAQTSLSFGSATSTQNVSVSSNISWTVSDNTSWISESPASGSGNGTVGISCSTNTSTNYRNGTVTITGGGISKTVNISQAGAIPPEYLNVSPLNILFNEYSSSHYVLVDSNVNWTVSNNVFWLSVSPSSGSNVGSFKIQSQTNLGLGSRNGTITVSGGGITKVINITQKGNSGDL